MLPYATVADVVKICKEMIGNGGGQSETKKQYQHHISGEGTFDHLPVNFYLINDDASELKSVQAVVDALHLPNYSFFTYEDTPNLIIPNCLATNTDAETGDVYLHVHTQGWEDSGVVMFQIDDSEVLTDEVTEL